MRNLSLNTLVFSLKIALPLSLAMSACASSEIQWRPDGSLENSSGQKAKLDIVSVFNALTTKKGIFLMGFKVGANDVNYPTAAFVSTDLKNVRYWEFENILQQFFIYDGNILLLDMEGEVFRYENQEWKKGELKFEPNSTVFVVDDDLIACHPSSSTKENRVLGGCQSAKRGWKVAINWWTSVSHPKICGNDIVLVELKNKRERMIKRVNITNGEVTAFKPQKLDTSNLCEMSAT